MVRRQAKAADVEAAARARVRQDTLRAATGAIRGASLRQLVSAAWLEYELLPSLGLSEVFPQHYPRHLQGYCGTGLRSFQMPNQFARYLSHLARRRISSYLEIGVWQGGTFIITVEYLQRFNDLSRALAVDVTITDMMREYAAMNDRVALHEGDSKTAPLRALVHQAWWDLVLIDGDHSEEGCLADYHLVRDGAGMIALHDIESDICPAVGSVWRQIAGITPLHCLHEFTGQYVEVIRAINQRTMGIGLIEVAPDPA